MQAIYVNAFINATKEIFEKSIGLKLEIESIVNNNKNINVGDVAVLIGVTRGVKGQVMHSYGKSIALKVAKAMTSMNIEELDGLSESALAELSNWISGTAATTLEAQSVIIDIAPPSLLRGLNMTLSAPMGERLAIIFKCKEDKIQLDLTESTR